MTMLGRTRYNEPSLSCFRDSKCCADSENTLCTPTCTEVKQSFYRYCDNCLQWKRNAHTASMSVSLNW